MGEAAAPRDGDRVAVEVDVPGTDLDDFELVAEVGEEPPEAVERTEAQILRSHGS